MKNKSKLLALVIIGIQITPIIATANELPSLQIEPLPQQEEVVNFETTTSSTTTINQVKEDLPFTDVKIENKYFDSISYLKENKIIDGYDDGTFQPKKTINRAEFLKLVIEGTTKTTNKTVQVPFTDVKKDSWYEPYVAEAYTQNWIKGYNDNTFKPQQEITKVEALKIIAKIQNWDMTKVNMNSTYDDIDTSKWYASYVYYAKNNNFLENTGEYFTPNNNITRGEICEILFKSITVNNDSKTDKSEEINQSEILTEVDTIQEDFNPIFQSKIKSNFFSGLTLDEDIPNTFYAGEIYNISGETNNSTATTIFLNKENSTTHQTIFREDNGKKDFSIDVYFKEIGNYKIGIVDGESGTSKITELSVINLENNQNKQAETSITNAQVSFKNDKAQIHFTSQNNENIATLKKVTFSQNKEKVTYITRQDTDNITLDYKDFKNFNTDTIKYETSIADLNKSIPLEFKSTFRPYLEGSFTPTSHQFSEISNQITTTIPEIIDNKETISFSGTLYTDAKQTAYIIKPDGFIDTIKLTTDTEVETYLGSNIIPENSSFKFEYTPAKTATYIIEITDKNGLPILNTPVYIGNQIPILPNFFDTHERLFFDTEINLKEMREDMLEKINRSRNGHYLDSITLSEELNNVAQKHSEDMANNDYFAHINLQNQTPEDRRKELGIKTPISENIAKDVDLDFAHLGLMRSATHRENILDKGWDKVGIGIAEADGYLFITEEFASNIVQQKDLEGMKVELLNKINELRLNNNVTAIEQTNELNNTAIEVNTLTNLDNLTDATFKTVLQNNKIYGSTQAIGRIYHTWEGILDSILNEEPDLYNQSWSHIGIALQINEDSNIVTTIILND